MSVVFRIEVEREADGRWIAEVIELPGVLVYGSRARTTPSLTCRRSPCASSPTGSRTKRPAAST